MEGQLTNKQIVRLAASIEATHMPVIAEGYMNIDDVTIKNKKSENKDDTEAFNREIIKIWRNKNPDNQIKVSEFIVTCNGVFTLSYGSFTLHGTGNGTGTGPANDGFLYYAMYCSHYTGTGAGNGNGDQWVAYPFTTGTGTGSCTEQ